MPLSTDEITLAQHGKAGGKAPLGVLAKVLPDFINSGATLLQDIIDLINNSRAKGTKRNADKARILFGFFHPASHDATDIVVVDDGIGQEPYQQFRSYELGNGSRQQERWGTEEHVYSNKGLGRLACMVRRSELPIEVTKQEDTKAYYMVAVGNLDGSDIAGRVQLMLPLTLLQYDFRQLDDQAAIGRWTLAVEAMLAAEHRGDPSSAATALAKFKDGASALFKEFGGGGKLELWKVMELCKLVGDHGNLTWLPLRTSHQTAAKLAPDRSTILVECSKTAALPNRFKDLGSLISETYMPRDVVASLNPGFYSRTGLDREVIITYGQMKQQLPASATDRPGFEVFGEQQVTPQQQGQYVELYPGEGPFEVVLDGKKAAVFQLYQSPDDGPRVIPYYSDVRLSLADVPACCTSGQDFDKMAKAIDSYTFGNNNRGRTVCREGMKEVKNFLQNVYGREAEEVDKLVTDLMSLFKTGGTKNPNWRHRMKRLVGAYTLVVRLDTRHVLLNQAKDAIQESGKFFDAVYRIVGEVLFRHAKVDVAKRTAENAARQRQAAAAAAASSAAPINCAVPTASAASGQGDLQPGRASTAAVKKRKAAAAAAASAAGEELQDTVAVAAVAAGGSSSRASGGAGPDAAMVAATGATAVQGPEAAAAAAAAGEGLDDALAVAVAAGRGSRKANRSAPPAKKQRVGGSGSNNRRRPSHVAPADEGEEAELGALHGAEGEGDAVAPSHTLEGAMPTGNGPATPPVAVATRVRKQPPPRQQQQQRRRQQQHQQQQATMLGETLPRRAIIVKAEADAPADVPQLAGLVGGAAAAAAGTTMRQNSPSDMASDTAAAAAAAAAAGGAEQLSSTKQQLLDRFQALAAAGVLNTAFVALPYGPHSDAVAVPPAVLAEMCAVVKQLSTA